MRVRRTPHTYSPTIIKERMIGKGIAANQSKVHCIATDQPEIYNQLRDLLVEIEGRRKVTSDDYARVKELFKDAPPQFLRDFETWVQMFETWTQTAPQQTQQKKSPAVAKVADAKKVTAAVDTAAASLVADVDDDSEFEVIDIVDNDRETIATTTSQQGDKEETDEWIAVEEETWMDD